MNRPTVTTKNELISVEGWKPEAGDDYCVRLAHTKIRARRPAVDLRQLTFRFDSHGTGGGLTSWPKKWDPELRRDLEKLLPTLVRGARNWPDLESPVRVLDRMLKSA